MKTKTHSIASVLVLALVLTGALGVTAQHRHEQTGNKTSTDAQKKGGTDKPGKGMQMDMSEMMQSPHHKLMTAYVESISVFAGTLRDQVTKSGKVDADFARASAAEIRHNFDRMEAGHEQHMQAMSVEMRSHMQMMMQKMDAERSSLKDEVAALEKDVQAENPDARQVAAHASAILSHTERMSKVMSKGM